MSQHGQWGSSGSSRSEADRLIGASGAPSCRTFVATAPGSRRVVIAARHNLEGQVADPGGFTCCPSARSSTSDLANCQPGLARAATHGAPSVPSVCRWNPSSPGVRGGKQRDKDDSGASRPRCSFSSLCTSDAPVIWHFRHVPGAARDDTAGDALAALGSSG